MASRPKGYGLSGEVNRKIASKYDLTLEQEARLWMEAVLGEELGPRNEALGPDRMQELLRDGVILCRLLNAIQPNSVKFKENAKMPFHMMENIGIFLNGCEAIGIKQVDLFQTADLYDKTNMFQVINAIFSLGRKAQKLGYNGPTLGAKEADSNPRNFSEETLNQGQAVIGLQMGSNRGASQAGMSFGRARSINEHGATGYPSNGHDL